MIQIDSLKPSEILSILSDKLASATSSLVQVRGIYSKSSKSYGNLWYDSIRDENTDQEIAVKITPILREGLQEGNLTTVTGTLERKTDRTGAIRLCLCATRTEVLQEQVIDKTVTDRIAIRNRKIAAGFKNPEQTLVNALLEGRKPRIVLFYADSSITDADFNEGIRTASSSFELVERRVPFTRTEQLMGAIRNEDTASTDAICIVRGGGSGLEVLENTSLLSALAEVNAPLVTAVGHTKDKVFINEIADKVIGTPSLLGAWLLSLADKAALAVNNSYSAIETRVKAQMKTQVDMLVKQNDELTQQLKKANKRMVSITAVLVLIVILAIII